MILKQIGSDIPNIVRYNFEIVLLLIFIMSLLALLVYSLKKKNLKRVIITIFTILLIIELTLRGTSFFYYHTRTRLSNTPITYKENAFRILCLGESTTFGTGVDYYEAYPAQLEKMLEEEYPNVDIEVYNHGIPGCTSTSILRGIDYDLSTYKPHLVILLAGSNDYTLAKCSINSIRLWKFNLSFLKSLKTYKVLRVLIDILNPWTHTLQYGYRTYMFFHPERGNIDVENCPPPSMAWNHPTAYTIESSKDITDQFLYNLKQITEKVHKQNGETYFTGYLHLRDVDLLISKAAEASNASYIDVFIPDEERNRSLFVEDNWHPSVEGHKMIAQKLLEKIKKEKIIENFVEY